MPETRASTNFFPRRQERKASRRANAPPSAPALRPIFVTHLPLPNSTGDSGTLRALMLLGNELRSKAADLVQMKIVLVEPAIRWIKFVRYYGGKVRDLHPTEYRGFVLACKSILPKLARTEDGGGLGLIWRNSPTWIYTKFETAPIDVNDLQGKLEVRIFRPPKEKEQPA